MIWQKKDFPGLVFFFWIVSLHRNVGFDVPVVVVVVSGTDSTDAAAAAVAAVAIASCWANRK